MLNNVGQDFMGKRYSPRYAPAKATDPRDPDGQVLAKLHSLGSDFTKLHPVDFFLYAPGQEEAKRMQQSLQESGYDADISAEPSGTRWLCVATKRMVPTHASLLRIRSEMITLAKRFNGEYDGWGTPVVD